MQQSNTTVIDEPREDAELEPQEPICKHHWRIAAPNGATSTGTCKICGSVREFANSSTDSIWENDSSDGGNRWRGRGRNAPVADVATVAAEGPAPISESTLGSLLGGGFRQRYD